MINAVVPQPGKSFAEAFDFKRVFAKAMSPTARRAEGRTAVIENLGRSQSKGCRQLSYAILVSN